MTQQQRFDWAHCKLTKMDVSLVTTEQYKQEEKL
jgi:hypothetical protein